MPRQSTRTAGRRRPKGEGHVFTAGAQGGEANKGYAIARKTVIDPVTGRKVRLQAKGKTQEVARERLRLKVEAVQAGNAVGGNGPTLGAWLDSWLAARRRRVAYTTWQSHSDHLAHVDDGLRRKSIARVTKEDVEALLWRLHRDGKAASTCNHVRSTLRAALEDARDLVPPLVTRNAAAQAERLPNEHREYVTLSVADLATLVEATEEMEHGPLWAVLGHTGLRLGEAQGLTWADVDLDSERPTLSVNRGWAKVGPKTWGTQAPKTPKSRRTIPLRAEAVLALRRQRERQEAARAEAPAWQTYADGQPVFTDAVGGRPNPNILPKLLARACREAKVSVVTCHELRHTFATIALRRGVSMAIVSRALGHSTIRLTIDTYGHLVSEDLDAIL